MEEEIYEAQDALEGEQTSEEQVDFEDEVEVATEIDPKEIKAGVRAASRGALAVGIFNITSTLLSILVITVGGYILELIEPGLSQKILKSNYFSSVMQILIGYVICFGIYRLVLIGIPTHKVEKKNIPITKLLMLIVVVIGSTQIVARISSVIDSLVSLLLGSDNGLVLFDEAPLWLNLLITVILAPVFEELMFRKLLFDRVSRYGDLFAIIFTSVAFGIFHGNLYQFIYTAVVGTVLGYAYSISRRIVYPIILHVSLNLYASLPTIIQTLFGSDMNTSTELEEMDPTEIIELIGSAMANLLYAAIAIGFIGGAVAIIIIAIVKKKIEIPKNGEVELRGFAIARVGVLNFGCMLLITVGAYEFLTFYLPTDPIVELLKNLIGVILK